MWIVLLSLLIVDIAAAIVLLGFRCTYKLRWAFLPRLGVICLLPVLFIFTVMTYKWEKASHDAECALSCYKYVYEVCTGRMSFVLVSDMPLEDSSGDIVLEGSYRDADFKVLLQEYNRPVRLDKHRLTELLFEGDAYLCRELTQ